MVLPARLWSHPRRRGGVLGGESSGGGKRGLHDPLHRGGHEVRGMFRGGAEGARRNPGRVACGGQPRHGDRRGGARRWGVGVHHRRVHQGCRGQGIHHVPPPRGPRRRGGRDQGRGSTCGRDGAYEVGPVQGVGADGPLSGHPYHPSPAPLWATRVRARRAAYRARAAVGRGSHRRASPRGTRGGDHARGIQGFIERCPEHELTRGRGRLGSLCTVHCGGARPPRHR
mmetsp:Transcript_9066/g.39907  ORF Transcript_9066/g.39907 Transcript_9066/m.39907 type:complete len:227 (-) Transcript_9066:1986-2666(-)